tara:strand:+ start:218 stop:364 length:147 start_codon:yes stop_codon:yes gene_type:complete
LPDISGWHEGLSSITVPNQEEEEEEIYNSLATAVRNFTMRLLASAAQT